MKARNGFIKGLRYICLIGVIAVGLMTIVGTNGGGGGGGESNIPPTATITNPSDGSTYNQGDTITFTGTGEDAEDGTLSGASLVWTSSIDGQIGTGTSFTRDDLSAGTHTITLTATDSEGATGSDSVSVTVNQGGLVAYYPFNGNANDESGNGNHGTVHGPTLTEDRFGNPNNAYSFDGVSDYISLDNLELWNFGTSSFSITAWFKSGTDDLRNIIRYDNCISEGLWGVRIETSGRVKFLIHDINRIGSCIITTASWVDNVWHFVSAIRDSDRGELRIYIDGFSAANAVSDGNIDIVANINAYPAIGRCGSYSGEYFNGLIDDVRIYNRVLSDEEIWEIYRANTP